ncbi:unnamed protein product [Caenorhabditis angaria]|uniref:Uncharacterized protein n=1 Tax=Caenorhabditis angaria TaxID=860376 RepID=A0A9P1I4U7_9PELO|nr:unnamed protein product [Caenorhabditis angaria]
MGTIYLVLILALGYNNSVLSQIPDGKSTSIVAKRVFLKFPSSYMNLTSESWKTQENDDELILALNFRPTSPVGQIFSVRFIRPDGILEALLRVTIVDENLNINLYNSEGLEVLNKPISNYKIRTTEQNIFLGLNTTSRKLSYRSSRENEFIAEITQQIDISNREIVVTLGGGNPSMIGCVSLVAVSVGDRSLVTDVNIIDSKDIDECPQNDGCSTRDCGEGICKMLEVATCDCYLTEMTGPNCRTPGSSLRLQNNDEEADISDYIQFTPTNSSKQITRIAMTFKFGDPDAKEGILIFGETSLSKIFKVYVVGRKGTVVIGDENIVDFDLAPNDEEFHTIIIRLNDTSFGILVDQQPTRKRIEEPILFETIQFGAAISKDDGVTELGLTACIKEVYIDHMDVIDLLHQNDPKVFATQTEPCSSSDSSDIKGVTMFEPDPIIPLSTDEFEDPIKSGNIFPIPVSDSNTKPPNSKSHSNCDQAQRTMCLNSASCSKIDENNFKCLCRDGFVGRYCQFSILPKSCSDARDFYDLPNGPTRIDVDGSHKIEPSIAMCIDGTTIVPHDMKNRTTVRDVGFQEHSLFVISYRDFKSQQLSKLMQYSMYCQQSISYHCNKAPLHFETGRTWFKSVVNSTRKIRQMSNLPNSCSCIDGGCISGGKCNCDSGSISQDDGLLQNSNAGIVEIVALRNEDDVFADVTLGSLECSGYVDMKKPIRFVEQTEMEISSWTGESIDIQFRTNNMTATIIGVRGKNDEKLIEVGLLDGNTIQIIHLDTIKTIESQKKLNDSQWHRIIVELSGNEFRFSVDDKHIVFFAHEGAIFDGNVILSSSQNGLIGCYRSVRINQNSIDLQKYISDSNPSIKNNCDSHCSLETCQNGAKCYEDFVVGTSFCQCAFPGVHFGKNCEIDLNRNTSVAFHGGHLKFNEFEDVFTSSIYFSFRTDQSAGLLLYAHDQNYNFIQVALSEETNITLTLNNLNIVSKCVVKAQQGTEFGDMRWIQVAISHTKDSSQLQVNDLSCTIRTTRALSMIPIMKFLNVFDSKIVQPPIGLGAQPVPTPYTITFIANIDDGNNRGSDGAVALLPRYQSSIPGFLGCLRGLQIDGNAVNIREKTEELSDKQSVRIGCDVGCESITCANGGHCSVAWINNDPTSQKTSCDCSRTSYSGSQCSLDDGIKFENNEWFSFDIGGVLQPYENMKSREPQLFKFAFSVKNSKLKILKKQRIASILLYDDRSLEVEIQPNRTINVILYGNNRYIPDVINFDGDFADGYRHFFVVQFHPNQATAIMLDSLRQDFPYQMNNFNLIHAKTIRIGENSSDSYDGFEGCVSNLLIDFQYGGLLHFTPIAYLGIPSHHLHRFVTTSSEVVILGGCSPFQVPNSLPVYRNRVEFPVWETDFRRQIYHGDIEMFDDDQPIFEETYNNSLIWLLVICIILFLVALLVFYTFMKCCKEQVHTRATPYSVDEEGFEDEPLTKTRYRPPQPSPPPQKKSALSNYHLPDPNVDFNRDDDHARAVSLTSSGISGYFTAQEYNDREEEEEEEEDREDDEGYSKYPDDESDSETIRHIDDDSMEGDMVLVSSPSQIRHVPRRVSSFRSSDSTAPIDSPLYTKPTKPANLVPVPPPRISPN